MEQQRKKLALVVVGYHLLDIHMDEKESFQYKKSVQIMLNLTLHDQ